MFQLAVVNQSVVSALPVQWQSIARPREGSQAEDQCGNVFEKSVEVFHG